MSTSIIYDKIIDKNYQYFPIDGFLPEASTQELIPKAELDTIVLEINTQIEMIGMSSEGRKTKRRVNIVSIAALIIDFVLLMLALVTRKNVTLMFIFIIAAAILSIIIIRKLVRDLRILIQGLWPELTATITEINVIWNPRGVYVKLAPAGALEEKDAWDPAYHRLIISMQTSSSVPTVVVQESGNM